MSNYSPVSSAAKAQAKGLPRRMMNMIDSNKARHPEPNWTQSRGRNYRLAIQSILNTYDGMIVSHGEHGKGKQRLHQITVLTPDDNGEVFALLMYRIPYRNPVEYTNNLLNIDIRPHAVQRLFQRFAGGSKSLALVELSTLLLTTTLPRESATWEMGTGHGLFIVETKYEETPPHAEAITWVDAGKLRPEQSAGVGEYRKIH